MNINEFSHNLGVILETIATSSLLRQVSSTDLAQNKIDFLKEALNATFHLKEMQFKETELSLMQKKTLLELEMVIAQNRIANLKAYADALSGIIQAESIKRSVVDNAAINKANAYVGYFNVAMNAIANNSASLNEGSALSSISKVVLNIIREIDSSALPSQYNTMLQNFSLLARDEALGLGTKPIGIYTPKLSLNTYERTLICGFSIYSNASHEFYVNSKPAQEFLKEAQSTQLKDAKVLLFYAKEPGTYCVSFKVKEGSKTLSESVEIEVRDKKERVCRN
ncbi:hypothetical protein [Helicobacter himalayensis]|uniref:hypothetical protein n=1 Tax=Helicobacter himalayensis TaxID=1591088 RepID=UPI00082D1BBD|nr:hypothetical protein [Helicobacter himalayensis]